MSVAAVDTYGTHRPDAEGWRGVPFRHPRDLAGAAQADGGKHTPGPCPRSHPAIPHRRAATVSSGEHRNPPVRKACGEFRPPPAQRRLPARPRLHTKPRAFLDGGSDRAHPFVRTETRWRACVRAVEYGPYE